MSVTFQRFVALRYLQGAQGREEGRRFLQFVTYVAVGGIAIGVAALLLALAVVRGFSREIEAKIVGFGAHVQVESLLDAPLGNAAHIKRELAQIEGIIHVAPVIVEFALLRRSAAEIDGVALWGTDAVPSYLVEHMVSGTASLASDEAGLPGAVIGARLAHALGAKVGDRVTTFSMRNPETSGFSPRRPRVRQLRLTGIYETDLADFDELYVFTAIEEARALLDYGPDEVTRFDLTLNEVLQADQVARSVEDRLGFPVMARTIYEVFQGLFAWVNLQESIIPLVIGVIILVAAFNIMGTLLMIMLEKAREIGILASMGASRQVLKRLFLWLGLLIGSLGTGIGLMLALILAYLQKRFALIPLPEEAYYMSSAPVALNILDCVVVVVVSLILCAISAYLPAHVASRIEPLRVIRFR